MSRRLVLVVPVFPRASETFIVNKFLGLLEKGWDVHVVCDRRDDDAWSLFPDLCRDPSLRRRVHTALPVRPRWKVALLWPMAVASCLAASPATTLRYLGRAWRRSGRGVLRSFYIDAPVVRLRCAVLHFEFGALAVGRMALGDLLFCPIVVSFRGYDLNYVGLEDVGYYAEVWKKAAAIHLLGNDLWRRAQRRGCPSEKPHALIAPAIDPEFFAPRRGSDAARRGRPFRILAVGRLEWKKGYEDAMVAVKMLHDRGLECEYRIVGDGSFLGGVAFARHQLGLEGVVTFLGAGSRDLVRAEMQEADVLLHAAVSEGFCNAVLEAQSMELPVVCTDADGLPENVEDGITGIVVPRREPRLLADALAKLAADPGLRRRMGEAGRRRVASEFRLKDQISAFDLLYRSVLSAQTPPFFDAPRSEASGTSA